VFDTEITDQGILITEYGSYIPDIKLSQKFENEHDEKIIQHSEAM